MASMFCLQHHRFMAGFNPLKVSMFNFNFDANALSKQIGDAVTVVAQTLGTTAQNIWAVGVQGEIARGVANVTVSIISLIFCGVLCFLGKVFLREMKKSDKYDSEGWLIAIVVSYLAALIMLVIFIGFLYSGIMHLVAPQFELIMEIKNILTNNN